MKFSDTSYDIRHESRQESRKRLFDNGCSYLIYWMDSYMDGVGQRINRKDIAVITDYNSETNDFCWVWGCYSGRDYHSKKMQVTDLDPQNPRCSVNTHNPKASIFKLTEAEVTDKVYMEMI